MRVIEKIQQASEEERPFFSFEYFPPKTEAGVMNLYARMQRMSLLEPLFVDVTWGAGGSTADLTLELSANAQRFFGLDVMMHLTCSNMPRQRIRETLEKAKEAGIESILALRGDAPRGSECWEQCEDGFSNAFELVQFIRKEFGNSFCIGVAGYPEKHVEAESFESDLANLKAKVDAGAEFIISQVFYDVTKFLEFVEKARDIGISVPIIPGIMPIQNYNAFRRMTSFCKTSVPTEIWKTLKPIKENDAEVKRFGVDLAVQMCTQLLDHGIKGVHIYTLNLERSARLILERLSMILKVDTRKLPWRPSQVSRRQKEDVRPIFWANRPISYLQRTNTWDEFPNGRWGDSTSPAFGDLSNYHLCSLSTGKIAERKAMWGSAPENLQDIFQVFADFIDGKIPKLPWCATSVHQETLSILESLRVMNMNGFLSINSQPRVNGKPSTDPAVGWGRPDGFVYQKAYLEFFTSTENLTFLRELSTKYPSITYHAVDHKGTCFTNATKSGSNAVTWGVFPDSEIVQPTVVNKESFLVWKDEAFHLWLLDWGSIYPHNSVSRNLIQNIHDTFFLVNIVDNDFVNGDIFKFVDELSSIVLNERTELN